MNSTLTADVRTQLRSAEDTCRNYAEQERRKCGFPLVYVSDVTPMGAPRQTNRDRWNPLPRVVRYRGFKDVFRLQIGAVPASYSIVKLEIVALMPMSKSWKAAQRDRMRHTQHRHKPDIDNVTKAVLDTLWPRQDQGIGWCETRMFWNDTPGVVLTIWRKAGET